jgi:hypothetical protein
MKKPENFASSFPFSNMSGAACGRFQSWSIWNDHRAAHLLELLRQAAWVHENPEEFVTKEHPSGRRWFGEIMALDALAKFLRMTDASMEAVGLLLKIKEGFCDLERGIMPEIFRLDDTPLKQSRTALRKFHHAWIAALMEYLMSKGKAEKEAARIVARAVKENWREFANQDVDFESVMNWRKRIKTSSVDERNVFEAQL